VFYNNEIKKAALSKHIIFSLIFFNTFLFISNVSAQSKKLKEANSFYENKQYYKALEVYKSIPKETNTMEIKAKMADCYRLTKDFPHAEKYYSDVVNSPDKKSSYLFDYAECLKSDGKIAEAKTWYGEYLKLEPGDKKAITLFNSCSAYVDSVNSIKCIDLQNNQSSSLNFQAPEIAKAFIPAVFDASKVSIGDEKITEYYWDFEDNSIGLGAKVNHKFSENRIYTIRLIVTTETKDGAHSIHCAYKTVDVKPNYKPGNNNLLEIQKQNADKREKKQ